MNETTKDLAVGDRVRVTEKSAWPRKFLPVGTEGTVLLVHRTRQGKMVLWPYRVAFPSLPDFELSMEGILMGAEELERVDD